MSSLTSVALWMTSVTRGVDPGGRGGGQSSPMKILGWQTYRFAPPPPNYFDNLKKSHLKIEIPKCT